VKKSALAEGLKAAAGQPHAVAKQSQAKRNGRAGDITKGATVLIGGHFAPEVRRTLFLVQAEPENTGKDLKQLLGEAINDLCAKYGKPQPYSGED
jgi:hypothetical protein